MSAESELRERREPTGRGTQAPKRKGGLLSNTFPIARIGGVEIGVHISWLLIFGLVTWSLAQGYFPLVIPDLDPGTALVLGVISALLLFVSVLIHELAHAFVARARGLEARSITLFLFGGVANLGGEAKQPSTEFLIAVVGPLTSIALAGIAFVAANALDGAAAVVAGYLAVINLLLAVFNLVPGFPLDGGRVLRAIVWNATNSLRRGTEIAAGVGQLVAWLLMAIGFIQVLGGNLLGGIWIIAIGWFLMNAGQASLQQVILDLRLRRIRVGDVLRPDTTTVPPGLSVADLVERFLLPGNRRAMPVGDDERLHGLITLGDVVGVPVEERGTTPISTVMTPVERLVTISPADSLTVALERLGEGEFEQLPVVEGRTLVGMLTRADIMRQLQLREALSLPEDDRVRRS
jgi:Zn-dependent protease/CBS domain-containing protein